MNIERILDVMLESLISETMQAPADPIPEDVLSICQNCVYGLETKHEMLTGYCMADLPCDLCDRNAVLAFVRIETE